MNLIYNRFHSIQPRLFTFLLLVTCFTSCSPDDEDDNNGGGGQGNNTTTYFMNVTINGQAYQTNSVGFFGFVNQEGCLPVNYKLTNIGQIDIADYFLDAYLFRYENNEDIAEINPGVGDVIQSLYYFDSPEGGNSCNFRLVIDLEDKQLAVEDTNLLPSGTHSVTSINQVSQNSTEVTYAVEGNFSCSFINDAGQQINITGTYRMPIDCLL